MVVGVLGPLVVSGAEVPAARQQRLVLAALVAAAPQRVAADRLIEGLWPKRRPTDPRKALQVLVARLRKTLEGVEADIDLDDTGYALRIDVDEIDRVRFDQLCSDENELDEADLSDRRVLLEEALGLWRGEPFGELADEPLLAEVAGSLRLRRDAATSRLHAARLGLGEVDGLLPELTTWARTRPLDETAWCRLAIALHRAGRPTEAMRALHVHRRTVRDTAGLEPTAAVAELEAQLLADDTSAPDEPSLGNLRVPARSFRGRARDIRSLGEQLSAGRLVTLTGTGGIGKTTLAVHAATGVRHRHRDGVWLCELGQIESGQSIIDALAGTLGVRRQRGQTLLASVTGAFAQAEALVIIDNCEHVLDAAAELVAQLHQDCPALTLVVTSREPLGLTDELVYPLTPLPVPSENGPAAGNPAFDLFVDRALDAGAAIEPGEATTAAITEICRRLDGLPLAIELAAARARTMSISEMSIRLDERFRILAHNHTDRPQRQQTLWDAVDWSYRLLDPNNQELFCQLSIFLGGFTIESAAAVTARPRPDVEESVWSMVDRSLLNVTPGARVTRYHMLETLRQFGQEQLLRPGPGSGDVGAVQCSRLDRLATYFLDLAAQLDRTWRAGDTDTAALQLTEELPNFRLAFHHLLDSKAIDRAQQLVAALYYPGIYHYQYEPGATWAPLAVDLDSHHIGPHTAGACACAGWGVGLTETPEATAPYIRRGREAIATGSVDDGAIANLATSIAQFDEDMPLAQRAQNELDNARHSGDDERLLRALLYYARLAVTGVHPDGRDQCNEALWLARAIGHRPHEADALLVATTWDHSIEAYEQALSVAVEAGLSFGANTARTLLGRRLARTGNRQQACRHLRDALHSWKQVGDLRQWSVISIIAELLARSGQAQVAATLWGAVSQHPEVWGRSHVPQHLTELDDITAGRCMADGARLPPDNATALALDHLTAWAAATD